MRATPAEAGEIVRLLRARGDLEAALERCADAVERWRLDAEPESRRTYTCPFLVDEACSIYAARPHACRLYGNSYASTRGKLYACHLVEEALLGQTPALVNLEGTVAMLRLYPGTDRNQLFPWYAVHALPEDLEP